MPPVPALWSSRARASVVVGTIPAVLALPLELAFVGAVSEYGWSGQGSTAAMRESGAGAIVHWEVTALFVLWLVCAAQLLVAGIHVGRGLWPLSPGRRLTTVAVVAAPLAAVVLGLSMIRFSASLQPVVSGEQRNLITGATHFYYLRRGNPLAATALLWGGWTVGVGGWAVGLLAFGRLAAQQPIGRSSAGRSVQRADDGADAGKLRAWPSRAGSDDDTPDAHRPRWRPHLRVPFRPPGLSCPPDAGGHRRAVAQRCGFCAESIRSMGSVPVQGS